MADEVFDGTDVVRQLFREGQCVPDEAGDALPHGVVEAFNMIGFAGVLRDSFMLGSRNYSCVDGIEFSTQHFQILPPKANFATELSYPLGAPRSMKKA